jgi:competence protein ComEA
MDRLPDWRPVQAAEPSDGARSDAPAGPKDSVDGAGDAARWRVIALAGILAAIFAGGSLAATLGAPAGEISFDPAPHASAEPGPDATPLATASAMVVIDVGGAVERPGLYRLVAGSRVGDALAAAGGYSPAVDLQLAGQRINLAAPLIDGLKIHVPRRGEQVTATPTVADGPAAVPATGGGLIDVNTADQRSLETLPGIGPVTAGKIIAARAEAPFGSIEELLGRKVVGPATMEKIRQLITVTP